MHHHISSHMYPDQVQHIDISRKRFTNQEIENTRWVSFDIKFTRQGFESTCWHCEACRDIENTRWVSFDIKFTRQGFEIACWHREACQAIQHAFSKLSLVNLISKDVILVFYLSVYPFLFVWFDSLRPINNLSFKQGRAFLGWTSTKLGLMCLAQGPQRSDAGEARTRGLSVSSQALYHWTTALSSLPIVSLFKIAIMT